VRRDDSHSRSISLGYRLPTHAMPRCGREAGLTPRAEPRAKMRGSMAQAMRALVPCVVRRAGREPRLAQREVGPPSCLDVWSLAWDLTT
jgi:hypothetical protein